MIAMMRLCLQFFFFTRGSGDMHDLSCILSGLHDGGGGNDDMLMVADF